MTSPPDLPPVQPLAGSEGVPVTATKYLDALAQAGFVKMMKVGRSNYYVNLALNEILIRNSAEGTAAGA